jgi:aldehyde dehydrogenase (NAD+)
VINIVNGYGPVVGAALSTHPDIAKVSFTGSAMTGRAILTAAAKTFKRVTLELGGKGPQILLEDTDLATAIPIALASGFVNSGQACVAGTRLLVPEGRLDEALVRLKDHRDPEGRRRDRSRGANWPHGEPEAVGTGPVLYPPRRRGRRGAADGRRGAARRLERGWFVRPTVFTHVTNQMWIAREEIFGPVLCVIPYCDEAEAIAIANDTSYGLQSYVLSSDVDHAKWVAGQLQAGRVVINGAPHEPLAPFGGFKQSGIGREFGTFGLDAFLEPRAVLS